MKFERNLSLQDLVLKINLFMSKKKEEEEEDFLVSRKRNTRRVHSYSK